MLPFAPPIIQMDLSLSITYNLAAIPSLQFLSQKSIQEIGRTGATFGPIIAESSGLPYIAFTKPLPSSTKLYSVFAGISGIFSTHVTGKV